MTDALLVADQHVSEGFLASSRLRARGPECAGATQTPQVSEFWQYCESDLIHAERRDSVDDNSTVGAHLSRGKSVLASLAQAGPRVRQLVEMKWLAENRRRYPGKWIAIEGDRLLAVGSTSQEVFSKVADRSEPALVVRIDEEDLPFAGW